MEHRTASPTGRHHTNTIVAYLFRESNPLRDFEEHTFKPWNTFDEGLEARTANGAWYWETPLKFVRGAVLGAGAGTVADAIMHTGSTYSFYGAVIGGLMDAAQYQSRGMLNLIRAHYAMSHAVGPVKQASNDTLGTSRLSDQ